MFMLGKMSHNFSRRGKRISLLEGAMFVGPLRFHDEKYIFTSDSLVCLFNADYHVTYLRGYALVGLPRFCYHS